MKDILDDNADGFLVSETKYRYWAFRMLLYLVVINLIVFIAVVSYYNNSDFLISMDILNVLFLIAGTVFVFLSWKNQEPKDLRFIVSGIGIGVFLTYAIFSIASYWMLS